MENAPPGVSLRALVRVHYSRILIGSEKTVHNGESLCRLPGMLQVIRQFLHRGWSDSWSSNDTYWPSKNIRGVGAAKLKAMECRLLVIACDQARADAERVEATHRLRFAKWARGGRRRGANGTAVSFEIRTSV